MATKNTFKGFKIGGNAMHQNIGLVQVLDYYKKLDVVKIKVDCTNTFFSQQKQTLLVPLEYLTPCN
jgi:hypothetical protein